MTNYEFLALIMMVVTVIIAISIPCYLANKQNKIALFEKRVEILSEFMNLGIIIQHMKDIKKKNLEDLLNQYFTIIWHTRKLYSVKKENLILTESSKEKLINNSNIAFLSSHLEQIHNNAQKARLLYKIDDNKIKQIQCVVTAFSELTINLYLYNPNDTGTVAGEEEINIKKLADEFLKHCDDFNIEQFISKLEKKLKIE